MSWYTHRPYKLFLSANCKILCIVGDLIVYHKWYISEVLLPTITQLFFTIDTILLKKNAYLSPCKSSNKIRINEFFLFVRTEYFLNTLQKVGIHCKHKTQTIKLRKKLM